MSKTRYGALGNGRSAWEVYDFYKGLRLLHTFTADQEKALCKDAIKKVKGGKIKEVDPVTLEALKCMKLFGISFDKATNELWYMFAQDRAVEAKKQLEASIV